jgi:hypothetical protein
VAGLISLNWRTVLALTAGGVVVYHLAKREAGEAAEAVGRAVDPTSPDNVFAAGTDAVGRAVTGEDGWTLGGAIYDWTHDDPGHCFTKVRMPDGSKRAIWHECGTDLPPEKIPTGAEVV